MTDITQPTNVINLPPPDAQAPPDLQQGIPPASAATTAALTAANAALDAAEEEIASLTDQLDAAKTTIANAPPPDYAEVLQHAKDDRDTAEAKLKDISNQFAASKQSADAKIKTLEAQISGFIAVAGFDAKNIYDSAEDEAADLKAQITTLVTMAHAKTERLNDVVTSAQAKTFAPIHGAFDTIKAFMHRIAAEI